MRLFQQNRALHTMSGRGSTIFSQKMVFHSLSHRRVPSSLQVPLAVPGVSQKQRCCGAGVSVHTFPDAELPRSPTAVGNTTRILAVGHESWMPSQSLGVAPTHGQGPEGRGDLCGDNVWGDREGTHGGEETLRIQRSLRRREQLQRAAAAQELSPSARHSTTSSGHLLEGTLALITKGNCSKETICSSQPQG